MDISHLPPDLREGIENYEADIASGELTFDREFAHKPGDMPDLEFVTFGTNVTDLSRRSLEWMEFFASRLPDMDIGH